MLLIRTAFLDLKMVYVIDLVYFCLFRAISSVLAAEINETSAYVYWTFLFSNYAHWNLKFLDYQ